MHIEVNGARLFFDTVGSQLAIADDHMQERQTLIVLHGGPGLDHSTLRPYFDRFADTHQVVYLDHRGNGRSTGAADTWTLAQWGDDVKAFCDALGIRKPVVYGNSFGGMVAMAYATRHPHHPAKLILSSTAVRLRLDETSRLMQERGGDGARDLADRFWSEPDADLFSEYLRVCGPLYNPPKPGGDASPNPAGRAIQRAEVTTHFILGEMRTMDQRLALGAIACPTLITVGDYDPITPVACSQEIFAALPAGIGQLEIVAGAGHGVHRDMPDLAEALYRRFLGLTAPGAERSAGLSSPTD